MITQIVLLPVAGTTTALIIAHAIWILVVMVVRVMLIAGMVVHVRTSTVQVAWVK